MADIELVIKINKDIAQGIINGQGDEPRNIVRSFQATIADAIKNGTLLPKGHGDLIDRNELSHKMVIEDVSRFKEEPEALAGLFLRMCDKEQPIIKADKGESEVQDADSN